MTQTNTLVAWTPEIQFETNGDLSVSYSLALGNYYISNGVCTVACRLICTPTFTTASGYLFIPGNPQANASGDIVLGSCLMSGSGINLGSGFTQTNSAIPENDDIIYFFKSGNEQNYNTINASNIASGTAITIFASASYFV